MGPVIVFFVWFVLPAGSYVVSHVATYDQPVPERCSTFDKANDYKNKNFCDQWKTEHALRTIKR